MLPWDEVGKAFAASVVAAGAAGFMARFVPLHGSRIADLESLALTTAVWAGIVALGLWLLKSTLPHELRRRKEQPIPPGTAPSSFPTQ
jgi:hypothetical protein